MNRELRRAQKKAEEKQQKEKVRVRQAKRQKREEIVARRKNRIASGKAKDSSTPSSRRSNPGRFARALSIVTAAFIVFQSVPVALLVNNAETAQTQSPTLTLVVKVLYYLMFGYFAFLWAARSNVAQALNISIGAGLGLAAALLLAQFVIPTIQPEFVVAALAVPAVVLGAFGGQLVWNRA